MAATAINTATIVTSGQAAAGASGVLGGQAAGAAAGPLAGFEALLAALFPQPDPTAVVAGAAAPGAGPVATPPVGKDALIEAAGEDKPSADLATPLDGQLVAAPAVDDATAALIASLTVVQPTTAQAAPAQAVEAAATAPAVFGQEKTKGAATAFAPANPRARLAEKAGLTADTAAAIDEALGDTAGADPVAEQPTLAKSEPASAPRTSAAPRLAPQAAAPAPMTDAKPATTAQDAPQADAAPLAASDAAAQTAPEATPAAATTLAESLATAPQAAPAPAPRPTRAERRAADAAAPISDLAPSDAPEAAPQARPVTGAAKTASADVDAGSARAEAGKTAAPEQADDTPDATPRAEARAAEQSAAPATQTTHAVRGSPETVANLAAQIVKKLDAKSTRFDLELNPGGLGKVDVRIDIGAHGRISAAMTFDNPQAASDLKARANELQRALEQAGFDLSGGLTFDVAQDRGQRQAQQDHQDQDNFAAFRGQAFRAALDTAGDADAAAGGALRLRRGVTAGLDLRI